jgi:hypothetical protein
MVCKKNTSDLYWFGPKNALRPVGRRVLYCLCTEVLVVGGYKLVREREELSSLKMCKCGTFARDESNCLWIRLSSVPFGMVPALPFIDARGTQGYMQALRDVFPRKEDPRSPILSYSWWCTTVGGVAPSFNAVATCPDIRVPVDDAATTHRVMIILVATRLSLRFD